MKKFLKVIGIVTILVVIGAVLLAVIKFPKETGLLITSVLGFCLGAGLGLYFLAYALAKHNIFFTFVEEGSAKLIMVNKQFKRCVMRYKGFGLNHKNEVVPDKRGRESASQKNILVKLINWCKSEFGGLVWIGIWPFNKLHNYEFRWQTWKKEEGTSKDIIVQVKKPINYVFVKASIYSFFLERAETKGMFPTNVWVTLVIRITNPYKALFRSHQWFEMAVGMIAPHIRQFVAGQDFEELVKENQQSAGKLYKFLENAQLGKEQKAEIENLLQETTDEETKKRAGHKKLGVLQILETIFGVRISEVKFNRVEPADKAFVEALSKERESVHEAKRIENINKAVQKFGVQGILVRYFEAIEKTGQGQGNTIIPLGIGPLLKEISTADIEKLLKRGGLENVVTK